MESRVDHSDNHFSALEFSQTNIFKVGGHYALVSERSGRPSVVAADER